MSKDDEVAAIFRERTKDAGGTAKLTVVPTTATTATTAQPQGSATPGAPPTAPPPGQNRPAAQVDGLPAVAPESVLDAIKKTRDGLLKQFETQIKQEGLTTPLDDPAYFSSVDRGLIEEAWARAGIPTISTPRGIIELTNGILASEHLARTLDARVQLEVGNLDRDLRLLEAGTDSAIELKKLAAAQEVARTKTAGATNAVLDEMKLEEARLNHELKRLNGAVVRRREEIEKDLALRRAEADESLRGYQQDIDIKKAEISKTKVEADLRRLRHRAIWYDHKYRVVSGAVVLVLLIAAIVWLAQ